MPTGPVDPARPVFARVRARRLAVLVASTLVSGLLASAVAAVVLSALVGPDTVGSEVRVNLAGRQRMLTERTCAELLAAALATAPGERSEHAAAVRRAAKLLWDTESSLRRGGPVLGLTGEPTGDVLPPPHASLRRARQQVRGDLTGYARQAVTMSRAVTSASRVDASELAGLVDRRAALVSVLDVATRAEQTQAATAAALSRRTAVVAIGVLGALAAAVVLLAARHQSQTASRRLTVAADARMRAVLNGSREATLVMSRDGIVRFATPAVEALGLDAELLVGHSLVRHVVTRDRERAVLAFARGSTEEVELDLLTGAVVGLALTDLTSDPTVNGLVVHVRDVTELRRAGRVKARRDATSELLRSVASAANTSLSVAGALQIVLDDVCEHFDWKLGHALVIDPETGDLRSSDLWATRGPCERFATFRAVSREMVFVPGVGLPGRVLCDREPIWVADVIRDSNFPRAPYAVQAGLHAAAAFPIVLEDTVIAVLEFFDTEILSADDDVLDVMRHIGQHLGRVAEREQTATVLRRQALTDDVTGLANRVAFQSALSGLRSSGSPVTVLYLDLDDFKDVNDVLGHAAGDDLLRHVALTLSQASRGSDVVARVGGDEFAILTTCPPGQAESLAERILTRLLQPALVAHGSVLVSASMGIAAAADDGVNDLMVEADLALYAAKGRGKSCWVRYDSTLADELRSRTDLDDRLRAALAEGGFEVHYQPVVDALTLEVVSAEALLRWPGSGLGPAEFVPRLEVTGLVVPVGRWVLETACLQAAQWRAAGLGRAVAVNVSPRQIATAGFEHEVADVLSASGLPAELLVLEVTETAADGLDVDVLHRLSALGVRMAVDDFGTGYSSMTRLRTMPTDTVKIDRSFVNDLTTSAQASALVRSMIELSHALGRRVVAEGVETHEQRQVLVTMGCDLLQGYLFGRPVPAADLDPAHGDEALVG